MSFLDRFAQSIVVEIVLTIIVYCIYAAVIAMSLTPAVWMLLMTLPDMISALAQSTH